MFKKTRKFITDRKNMIYIDQFLKLHRIEHEMSNMADGKISYETRMNNRLFNAFCEHLEDLRKFNVFPIIL